MTGCFDTDLNGDLRGVEEMFIPIDEDDDNNSTKRGAKEGKELSKEAKKEKKLRRERKRRVAKKKIRESVEGWRKMFDGGKQGRYFYRGKVNRGEGSGWEGWREVKTLCEKARQGRERRTAEQVGKR